MSFKFLKEKVTAIPGIIDLIKQAKQKGLKIALATSGRKFYVDVVLEKLDIKK